MVSRCGSFVQLLQHFPEYAALLPGYGLLHIHPKMQPPVGDADHIA
jgi:hypothetical protein